MFVEVTVRLLLDHPVQVLVVILWMGVHVHMGFSGMQPDANGHKQVCSWRSSTKQKSSTKCNGCRWQFHFIHSLTCHLLMQILATFLESRLLICVSSRDCVDFLVR